MSLSAQHASSFTHTHTRAHSFITLREITHRREIPFQLLVCLALLTICTACRTTQLILFQGLTCFRRSSYLFIYFFFFWHQISEHCSFKKRQPNHLVIQYMLARRSNLKLYNQNLKLILSDYSKIFKVTDDGNFIICLLLLVIAMTRRTNYTY